MTDQPGQTSSAQILLVEDNPGDARLARHALRECAIAHDLHVVGDGVQAMSFLNREGPYASAPRPHLILLDLNLPRKDGREVLREIKQNDTFRTIPVVVLTTSSSEKDVNTTYTLHANSYITKPLDFLEFVDILRANQNFWFSTVRLPTM